ncbi:MAG: oxygen-independent coproporphyrinogen III oxidase [Bacteroidales bacterium]
MTSQIIEKYNIPVPRYTSYPPANFFSDSFNEADYIQALDDSNTNHPKHISIYIHIPFCKHMCYYCGCNSYPMMKQEIVDNYIAALKQELKFVLKRLHKDRKISQIHYGGGSPSALSPSILKDLNNYILSRFNTIENPEIAIECHPGYLSEEQWIAIAEAGFNRISIGVQDLHQDVLDAVHRKSSLLSLSDIFAILRKRNIAINLDFIYGLPLQTKERFLENMKTVLELQPDRVVTFSYAHVPWVNSNMKKLEEIGLPSQSEKKAIFDCITEELTNNGYLPIGIDHFVKPEDELYKAYVNKQLHRNFQGYCTKRTTGQVYAFGVSAISQLADAYAQNTKSIQEYIEHMNSDFDIIRKGYKLTLEQQIVRDVIMTIMCNECLIWDELALNYTLKADSIKDKLSYANAKLEEMESDGLLTISTHGIYATNEGKIFTRNIAAAFDPLLVDNAGQRYSKPI